MMAATTVDAMTPHTRGAMRCSALLMVLSAVSAICGLAWLLSVFGAMSTHEDQIVVMIHVYQAVAALVASTIFAFLSYVLEIMVAMWERGST